MKARLISSIIVFAAGMIGFTTSFTHPEWSIGMIPATVLLLSLCIGKDFTRFWFYTLCAGEACVVATGWISMPLALLVQILLLLALIIPDGALRERGQAMGFVLFLLGAGMITLWISQFHHMIVPAIILSAIALVTVGGISLQEYRLKRRYGGSA